MRGAQPDELAVFTAALERTGHERSRYLNEVCGSDHGFRARIEVYLKAHEDKQGPLDAPPPGMTATIQNRKPTDRIGETIGSYTLRELLGEGGMGAVYVAEQEQPVRRKVALKVIKPGMDSREVISRFESERQALAMMDHANIAKVFDAGTAADGRPYFVMELVKGIPITERCDENQMDVKQRLELFIQVCHAIQHAHQKGVIHRDLKPSNILVTMQDVTPTVKVIDFGVAKAMGGALTEKTVYTGFNQMIGTPLYMSPEQAGLSGLDVDTRSDVYSLGVLLYELLTGATPFGSQQLREAGYDELRRIIREDEPPRPSARLSTLEAQKLSTVCDRRKVEPQRLVQQMRGELDWIVMKALEKDRARRYESASDFALDVQRFLNDEMVEACPPSFVYRTRKFVARHKWPVITTVALVFLLLLGIFGTSIGFVRALQEKGKAQTAEKRAKEEAAVAKAVNKFLQEDLLGEADPEKNSRHKQVTVEELLGRAAERIEAKFAKQPRIEAAIRRSIGNAYRALGNFHSAEPHLKRALRLYQQTLGDNHPETLQSANDLAGVYVERGQYERAEPILVATLERRRHVLGAEHRDTLISTHNLAMVYLLQGNYAQAEPLCTQAWKSLRRVLGDDDYYTISALSNLASLYRHQEHFSKAEPLAFQALEKARHILGEEHPRTLICMNNLAIIYLHNGEYAKAESLFLQALQIGRRVLGGEHPDTLTWMGNLAQIYARQNEYAKAEPLEVAVLEARRQALGVDHPHTMIAMENLAENYLNQSKYAEAERLYVELIDVRRRVQGKEHPDTLSSMEKLATAYVGQSKIPQCMSVSIEALEVRRRAQGNEAPETLKAINDLAQLHALLGEHQKAEDLYMEVLETSRRVRGGDHVETIAAINRLAELFESQREFGKAEPYRTQLLELTRKSTGDQSPQTADALFRLGSDLLEQKKFVEAELRLRDCLNIRERLQAASKAEFETQGLLGAALLGQKNYSAAEPLLLQAYEGIQRTTGQPSLQTVERLVRLYDEWDRPEELAKWQQELMSPSLPEMQPNNTGP